VILIDNNSVHVEESIIQIIEAAGYVVRFPSLYSPDFNSIKSTFLVLKSP
ncbi:hypothetical protein K432DRAFT_310715, partial [Lepidopterella palustris CBS 459.81]